VSELLPLLAFGFVLGMRHATDPDHIIAVTTLVTRESRIVRAMRLGLAWGVGHTVTVMLVGGAIVLFRLTVPPRVGLSLEFGVGLMLIALGVVALGRRLGGDREVPGLRAAFRPVAVQPLPGTLLATHAHAPATRHFHVHTHGDYVHAHVHDHGVQGHGHAESATPQARVDRLFGGWRAYGPIRPLVVGIVHGLAGSAALALLALASVDDPLRALVFLALFGGGTVLGMMLLTALVAVPLELSARRLPSFHVALQVGAALLSIGYGGYLMWQIGFAEGLFSATPNWTPH
jgi:high-affinity nickel-transport protein